MSADPGLGLVYVPVEMPTGDYYGGNRPGNTLFGESLVALDYKTGRRKWHYQTVHHGLWDYDLPCAPILFDMTVNGRTIKALAQPTKQAFLFVLNRETGEPIWPIEERPVPQSNVPKERSSPTQPFPTKPAPFDMQGITENDLMDLTPALKAEALEVVKRYRMGPLFTPPVVSSLEGPSATLQVPADVGGANWPGGVDGSREQLPVHPLAHGRLPQRTRAGQSRAVRHGVRQRTSASGWPRTWCRGWWTRGRAWSRARRRDRSGSAAGETTVRPDHGVQHEYRRYRLAESPQLDT